MRRLAANKYSVDIKRRKNLLTGEVSRAYYKNLWLCHAAWLCPICAAKKAKADSRLLQAHIERHQAQGGQVAMLTLTLSHKRHHSCQTVLGRLKRALVAFNSGKGYQIGLKAKFGIMGKVTALEVLHGEANGWHCHSHIILFLEKPLLPLEQAQMGQVITERWLSSLQLMGGDALPEHAAKITFNRQSIGDYVTKQGQRLPKPIWTLADELTNTTAKKTEGRTPFALLQRYGLGDKQAGKLFAEYVAAIKGHHMLTYSRGFKDVSLVDKTEDDYNIEQLLASLDLAEWQIIIQHPDSRLRGKLLKAANDGSEALAAFLGEFGIQLE